MTAFSDVDAGPSKLIAGQRLVNQRIAGAKYANPLEAVSNMGALQAQDYHQALWAIGLRVAAATKTSVETASARREIVITWPLRGTLHAIPARDVKWMLTICAPRILKQVGRRLKELGLDVEVIERCKKLIHDALKGENRLTRVEIMQLLDDAGISPAGQRGYHILWYLAQAGLICLGPREGNQQTFVLIDEWVPGAEELSREEALGRLATRYFTSHGPATTADFARWIGTTLADAKLGVSRAEPALHREMIAGVEYWLPAGGGFPPAHAGAGPLRGSTVFLLPGFDEYILGYKDRDAVLDPAHAPLVVPGSNGVFKPIVVVDGQVAGTWMRTIKKGGVEIAVHLFPPQTRKAAATGAVPAPDVSDRSLHDQLMAEARRYAEFLEMPLLGVNVVGC